MAISEKGMSQKPMKRECTRENGDSVCLTQKKTMLNADASHGANAVYSLVVMRKVEGSLRSFIMEKPFRN